MVYLVPSTPTRWCPSRAACAATTSAMCCREEPGRAEQLQIPVQGAVFVTLRTEFRKENDKARPFEVARGVYRVDWVQLRFDVASKGEMPAALWQIADS